MAASFAVPAPCPLFTTSAFGALPLITTSRRAGTQFGASSAFATAAAAERARWRGNPRSGRGSLGVRRSRPATTPRRHLAPARLPPRCVPALGRGGLALSDGRPSVLRPGSCPSFPHHLLPVPFPFCSQGTAPLSFRPVCRCRPFSCHLHHSPPPPPPCSACRHPFLPRSSCPTCWR